MNLLSKCLYHIAICRKKISFEYYGFIFPQYLTLFMCFVYCLFIRDESVEIRKYNIDGVNINFEVCNKIELSRIVFIIIVYINIFIYFYYFIYRFYKVYISY